MKSKANMQAIAIVACLVLLVGLCLGAASLLDQWGGAPGDWSGLRLAGQYLFTGRNPYVLPGEWQFYYPPWILLLLSPIMLIPQPYDAGVLLTISLLAFSFAAWKVNRKSPLVMVIFLLSAPVLSCLAYGQTDWLVLLGLFTPPWIGLFFVLLKPQLGIGIALYWLYRAGQEQKVLRTFCPVVGAFLLSFVAYGLWPLNWGQLLQRAGSLPLWPWTIAVGVLLMMRRQEKCAWAVGPFLSQYGCIQSWVGVLLATLSGPKKLVLVAWGALWVYHFLMYQEGLLWVIDRIH